MRAPAPTPPEPGSLGQDGWLAFVNAFDAPGGNRLYGYGPFPTPQGGPAFAGGVNTKVTKPEELPADAPRLSITTRAMFGGVNVVARPVLKAAEG